MKRNNRNLGFTIIETVLFLAISSSMLFVAMNLISGRSRQVQFTDSIRAIESHLDSKISQVKTGSVTLPNEACRSTGGWNPMPSYSNVTSDGSCIFLGYMFEFNNLGADTIPAKTEMPLYQMFGTRLNSSQLLACKGVAHDNLYCPTPVSMPSAYADNFKIPWSLEVTKHVITGTNNSVSKIGYLRDPSGSGIIPVAMVDAAVQTDRDYYDLANVDSWVGSEFSVKLCFSDGIRQAGINLGGLDDHLAVEAVFNDPDCPAV